jgi:hypothetical protein
MTMHRLIFRCAFLLLLPLNTLAQHVFFGERDRTDSTMAIHFDQDGFPYPDRRIPDSSMINAYGSLFTWFQQHNEEFIATCAGYNYFPERIDQATIFQLRDSIIGRWIATINERSTGYPAVAFYVHGFRKSFVQSGHDVTSVADFKLLEENLATYGKPKAFEVEVYWDGMYDCCFSMHHKKNRALFQLFETANRNALHVGLGLRRVLTGISTRHLQVIAHSLGARVVTVALFNQNEASKIIPTPTQPEISVCLIAPAIDGHETFQSYYDRTTPADYRTSDNYRLLVVYNESDFVLRKKDPKTGWFGPGTMRYGETSLGCNRRKEAVHLQAYFAKQYPHSVIRLVDHSDLGKSHSLRYYAQGTNLQAVSDFIWE